MPTAKEKMLCSDQCGSDVIILDQVQSPRYITLPYNSSADLCCICYEENHEMVVVYLGHNDKPCHVICVPCFKDYAKIAITERQFTTENIEKGSIIPCPVCSYGQLLIL